MTHNEIAMIFQMVGCNTGLHEPSAIISDIYLKTTTYVPIWVQIIVANRECEKCFSRLTDHLLIGMLDRCV